MDVLTKRTQGIYHVTVLYHEGQPRIRRAWLRCGGWLLGAKNEKVELRLGWMVPTFAAAGPGSADTTNPR